MDEGPTIQGLVRDLSLLVSWVFFAGLMHLVSYYGEFGFRFSDLDLKYHHILFRGITIVFTNYYAAGLAALFFVLLLVDLSGYRFRAPIGLSLDSIQKAVVLLCFPAIYVVSVTDGFDASQSDSALATTSLQKVVSIVDDEGKTKLVFEHLKTPRLGKERSVFLVHRSGNRLTLIALLELESEGASKPEVVTVLLQSGDSYAEAQSNQSNDFWRSLF